MMILRIGLDFLHEAVQKACSETVRSVPHIRSDGHVGDMHVPFNQVEWSMMGKNLQAKQQSSCRFRPYMQTEEVSGFQLRYPSSSVPIFISLSRWVTATIIGLRVRHLKDETATDG